MVSELLLSAADNDVFVRMWNGKLNQNFDQNDLETYEYVYSKKGSAILIHKYCEKI